MLRDDESSIDAGRPERLIELPCSWSQRGQKPSVDQKGTSYLYLNHLQS